MQYHIEKEGAMHIVYSNQTGLVQFQSLKRINCRDWVKTNTEVADEDEDTQA